MSTYIRNRCITERCDTSDLMNGCASRSWSDIVSRVYRRRGSVSASGGGVLSSAASASAANSWGKQLRFRVQGNTSPTAVVPQGGNRQIVSPARTVPGAITCNWFGRPGWKVLIQ